MSLNNQDNISDPDPFVRIMNRVWVRMTEIYSYEWTNRYGHKPSRGWFDVIKTLTLNEVRFGFEELIKSNKYADRPPSPIAFRELCKPQHNCIAPPSKEFFTKKIDQVDQPMSSETRENLNNFYRKLGWHHLVRNEEYTNETNYKAA